jgi:hypothetical protein
VLKWQRNAREKLTLIPATLISMVEKEYQILRHFNQRVEMIVPSISDTFLDKKGIN